MYITDFTRMSNDEVRVVHRRALRLSLNSNHKRLTQYRGQKISNPVVFELLKIERTNNIQVMLAAKELNSRGAVIA